MPLITNQSGSKLRTFNALGRVGISKFSNIYILWLTERQHSLPDHGSGVTDF